jgi:TPP-dependent pyruvate/acetoin dehydrogenase alpha subunit
VTVPRRADADADAGADVTWPRRDPIARMRRHLQAKGLVNADSELRLAAEVSADVDRVIGEASSAATPEAGAWFDDVYASPPWSLREQRAAMEKAKQGGKTS